MIDLWLNSEHQHSLSSSEISHFFNARSQPSTVQKHPESVSRLQVSGQFKSRDWEKTPISGTMRASAVLLGQVVPMLYSSRVSWSFALARAVCSVSAEPPWRNARQFVRNRFFAIDSRRTAAAAQPSRGIDAIFLLRARARNSSTDSNRSFRERARSPIYSYRDRERERERERERGAVLDRRVREKKKKGGERTDL